MIEWFKPEESISAGKEGDYFIRLCNVTCFWYITLKGNVVAQGTGNGIIAAKSIIQSEVSTLLGRNKDK